MAELWGHLVHGLLDSGCEWSVIGCCSVPDACPRRSPYLLSAVNKTALSVDGDMHFTVDSHEMNADVSLLPVINELLLGSDWLMVNKCRYRTLPLAPFTLATD